MLMCLPAAHAIPEFYPWSPAEFTATVAAIKDVRGAVPSLVVVLTDPNGLSAETAKILHKGLKRAKYRVRSPRSQRIELVFPKALLKGIEIGDRVSISDYRLCGHSESDLFWLSRGVKLVKDAKPMKAPKPEKKRR